jgi:hypothetical protein
MQLRFLIEYAQLHKMSLEQDMEYNPSSHLLGQIEATQHLINVANDINNGALFLSILNDTDTIGIK